MLGAGIRYGSNVEPSGFTMKYPLFLIPLFRLTAKRLPLLSKVSPFFSWLVCAELHYFYHPVAIPCHDICVVQPGCGQAGKERCTQLFVSSALILGAIKLFCWFDAHKVQSDE